MRSQINAGLAAIVVSAIGVASTVLGLLFGRRLSKSQANSFDADASKKLAEAKKLKVDTAIEAADYISNLSTSYLNVQSRLGKTERRMEAMNEAAEKHNVWDEQILETVNKMRVAMQDAGLGQDIPEPGTPPPLIDTSAEDDNIYG